MDENARTNTHYHVTLENMIIPVATFLYKEDAENWKSKKYGDMASLVACQASSLCHLTLPLCCNNLEHQQHLRTRSTEQT